MDDQTDPPAADPAPGDDEWTLSTAEVALRLGKSRPTVSRIKRSELPYMARGDRGHRRYRPADVEAYRRGMRVGQPVGTADRLDALEEDMARVKRHLGLDDDGG